MSKFSKIIRLSLIPAPALFGAGEAVIYKNGEEIGVASKPLVAIHLDDYTGPCPNFGTVHERVKVVISSTAASSVVLAKPPRST